jgi:hypothetical protein
MRMEDQRAALDLHSKYLDRDTKSIGEDWRHEWFS